MKTPSLRTAQSWTVAIKVFTVALSVVQTAIVLRLLSPAEYGVIGIVLSLGSLIGVTQHMGIVDATIREIAVTQDAVRRAHVFWVSLWTRLSFTVLVAGGLAMLASWIGARVYPLPDIPHLVRLMSVVLVAQGIQGVLGGAYTGALAFRKLYVFQIVMAIVNVPVFALFVLQRGTAGYFEAMIGTTILFSVMLAIFVRSVLGSLRHPGWLDVYNTFKIMFHTSLWTYIAKLVSVGWQRIPVLILGRIASPEVVGLFNVALTFGSKIVFALGIGEVNLAYLSSVFGRQSKEFSIIARRTLREVGSAVIIAAAFLTLFAPELLRIVAGSPYVPAASVVIVVTWAYALYVFLDIASHTVFVPANASHFRAFGFAVLLAVTTGSFFVIPTEPLMAAGWAVLLGSLAAVMFAATVSRIKLGVSLFSARLLVLSGIGCVLAVLSGSSLVIEARVTLFLLLGGVVFWIGFQNVIHNVFQKWVLRVR